MATRILITLIILVYSILSVHGQQVIDSSVEEILKGDNISLQLHSVGCFSSYTTTTTIIKQSADRFFITSENCRGNVFYSTISLDKFLGFGRQFSYEMKRKLNCRCTTSQHFTLSSGKKEVDFYYRCCNEENPPNKSFLILLGLSE